MLRGDFGSRKTLKGAVTKRGQALFVFYSYVTTLPPRAMAFAHGLFHGGGEDLGGFP